MSEDLLVDGYDYNPHTFVVEVPYNDYFDMKDKCKENKQLKDQLQQKESIIKEVREFVEKRKDTQIYFKGTFKDNGIDRQFLIEQYDDILEILDKGSDKE